MKSVSIGLTALAGVILLFAFCRQETPLPAVPATGISTAELASGRPHPSIGLVGPFPAWAPLPEKGLVTGAEVLAPQPPWGASAVAMIKIDDDVDHFMDAYGQRLAASRFRVRRVTPSGLTFDRPLAQFQSDDGGGGHVVYITFRGDSAVRYVQLTYWSPPAPHIVP